MNALLMTKNELITVLENNQFDHLSKNEQKRLREYLQQIVHTLQEAAELRHQRRRKRQRV